VALVPEELPVVNVREVAQNVYSIDDELYRIPRSGSVYFLAEGKKALIDSGPSTSSAVVLEGIRQIGFDPEEIDYLIITHIHLDHAGGAGTLLKAMPRARVAVHPRAVKHLFTPNRLISSVREVQGPEALVRNGEVLPVEGQMLIPAFDGDTIDLGQGQVLTILDAPGHAPHEICILESRNNGVFVGDAVGHHIQGTDIMVPVTPPPGFDLELYLLTLERLKKLQASRIYFAHTDTSEQVKKWLDSAARELKARDRIIAQAAAQNELESAAERVMAHASNGLDWVKREMRPVYDYWTVVDIPMSAAEHVRYYRKKHGL
jgi:glyoxylase-like metal-dependent hydrolase (beta-lactamase superfamily II)